MAPPKQQKPNLDFRRRRVEEKIRGLNGGMCVAGCDGRKVNFKSEYFILMRQKYSTFAGWLRWARSLGLS